MALTPEVSREDLVKLVEIARAVAQASTLAALIDVVRRDARSLLQADGVTFIRREGTAVFHVATDAVGPLCQGRRFPAATSLAGLAMARQELLVVADIHDDRRVPQEMYRGTFVKSLAIMPLGGEHGEQPTTAIGAYWGKAGRPSERALTLLQDLAGFVAQAIASKRFDVTDATVGQRQAEGALVDAEAAHRLVHAITANALSGMVIVDRRQICTFMNPAAEHILGYTLGQVQALHRPFHQIVHHTRPDGAPTLAEECPLVRALSQGTREQGEDTFVRKDGSFYPVAFTASPLFEQGASVGAMIEFADITERKAIEGRLQASERKFSAVFKHASFAICLVEMPTTVIAEVNPAWTELFGFTREEAVGRTAIDLHMHIDLDARQRVRAEFFRQGFVRNMETTVRSKFGRIVTVANSLDSIEIDGRSYVLGTYNDITERRKAEQAQRESERQFEDLIDNLPELAWSAAADGHIDFYNRRWYNYTGKTFEDMQGWGWKSVHAPDMLDEVVARWAQSLETGEPFEMEFPLRGADGVYRWFLTRVRPLRDSDGKIVRWFGTNTNIDDVKRARIEREQLVVQLRHTLEVREEFLSIAAHELRTPLTAVLLLLQGMSRSLVGETSFSPTKVSERLGTAIKQTQRLARLTEELLDVSRMSRGQFSLEREKLDAAELLRETVQRHVAQAAEARCELVVTAAPFVIGRWDKLRVEQVITNLLSNAIKYGRGRPVRLTLTVEDAQARLEISDQGIGIRPEDLPRIFDRFERAVPVRHFGGLGLGLYIARQIVEAHGGQIQASSVTGEGATFVVLLPLQPP